MHLPELIDELLTIQQEIENAGCDSSGTKVRISSLTGRISSIGSVALDGNGHVYIDPPSGEED